MKTRRHLLALGYALVIPVIHASERPAPKDAVEIPNYLFVPGCCIRRMAPITATVTHRHVDRAFLKTADGQKISIGGFGSSPDIVKFIASLKDDVSYSFPEVFLDHEKAMRGETLEVTEPTQKTLARHSDRVDAVAHAR
jgi:hypothetical protein